MGLLLDSIEIGAILIFKSASQEGVAQNKKYFPYIQIIDISSPLKPFFINPLDKKRGETVLSAYHNILLQGEEYTGIIINKD